MRLPHRARPGRPGHRHARRRLLRDPPRPSHARCCRPGRLRNCSPGPTRLRRTYGSAPRRLARPLSVAEIRQILGCIDRSTPIGIRDAAIILLGFASAMRRAEIVALTLGDVEPKPLGLLLHVRKSKTDQEGCGQVVGVAHGTFALTDPVAAIAAWRTVRGEVPGTLFTRIWARSVSLEALSGHVVARMLRARAVAAGLDGTRITAHSLRAGHATAAALAGVPLDRIAAQTRHKDLTVLVNRYIRPLEALANTSSKDLGL
ncbi:MAG: tyrosine-type recombinase/integrase [Cryobacterium sp.]|nr:tyrosine-type recombinase/integrase [Cryobacterium sp.]